MKSEISQFCIIGFESEIPKGGLKLKSNTVLNCFIKQSDNEQNEKQKLRYNPVKHIKYEFIFLID